MVALGEGKIPEKTIGLFNTKAEYVISYGMLIDNHNSIVPKIELPLSLKGGRKTANVVLNEARPSNHSSGYAYFQGWQPYRHGT